MVSPAEPTQRRCALCGSAILDPQAPFLPFCSERCKLIDLGKWLGEQYSLPLERHSDTDSAEEE